MEEKEMTIEQEVTQDCPILFQMRYRPCSETTMCWGFECGQGWHEKISSACRELEMLNTQYYPKYRVRIQADQIKEKFGTLHFYYSVVTDPNPFYTKLSHVFERLWDYFSDNKRFNYKLKKIVDVEPYEYDDTREITKEDFEKDHTYKCINEEFIEKDGKYFRITHLKNFGKYHYIPTEHKIAFKLKSICDNLRWFFDSMPKKDTAEVRNCIEFMERKAQEVVRKAEDECYNVCEECGHQIGTSWSKRYMTTGWITYVCEDCAKKSKNGYEEVKDE